MIRGGLAVGTGTVGRSIGVVGALATLLAAAAPARAFHAPELTAQQQKTVRDNFGLCVGKLKGPYTENICVCPDGRKIPVRNTTGQVAVPCKDELFCSAFRAPWAE